MRVFDMLVDERRHMAEMLGTLTGDQWRRPSLCAGWTVHEVAAHLTTYLRFGQAKLYLGIFLTVGDIDRINLFLTRRAARRSHREIIERLGRGASARTTIPRSGYDPVLTDIVLHDLDIRRPLGIPRSIPEERLRVAFNHLTVKPSPGYTMGSRLHGLCLEATDTGWAHGAGPLVRGDAEALLLAISGRTAAFDELEGDGVPLLRDHVAASPRVGAGRRIATVLAVLADPPPPERRSRRAVAPT